MKRSSLYIGWLAMMYKYQLPLLMRLHICYQSTNLAFYYNYRNKELNLYNQKHCYKYRNELIVYNKRHLDYICIIVNFFIYSHIIFLLLETIKSSLFIALIFFFLNINKSFVLSVSTQCFSLGVFMGSVA